MRAAAALSALVSWRRPDLSLRVGEGVLHSWDDHMPRKAYEIMVPTWKECRRVARPGETYFLYEEKGKGVCGTFAITREGSSGFLWQLAVAPRCRGKGVCKRMMKALAAYLNRTGMASVRLTVLSANVHAKRCYVSGGFSVVPSPEPRLLTYDSYEGDIFYPAGSPYELLELERKDR